MRARVLLVPLLALAGCEGTLVTPDAGAVQDAPSLDASSLDATGTVPDAYVVSTDAFAMSDAPVMMTNPGVAPRPGIAGERAGMDGPNAISASSSAPALIRIEAAPDEHITFFLTFDSAIRDVQLEVLRWNGTEAVSLGVTDGGAGLRTLAAFDGEGTRTFWARITTGRASFTGSLAITRTPFEDGPSCFEDCARLLQMPLPNDTRIDGYATRTSTVFRYQYGRRDLLMYVRHAAQRVASRGMAPIIPEDFSQWNGETPGNDVGSPRHSSHQRGKDVDIALHGLDGMHEWRSYCTARSASGGRECTPGTIRNYDGAANAIWFGDIFESGRVTMCFLDRELIPTTVRGAEEANRLGEVSGSVLPLFDDGTHLQHWPNHDNHIHVRVSESASIGPLVWTGRAPEEEAFEAP
jgi:hypothetical protein